MRSHEDIPSSTYRAVILTALPVEYRAVRAHLSELREETHPGGTIYERGRFVAGSVTWEVLLVEVGAGNVPAALETERALQHFQPDVALFVGVAGGLKDVTLGDVVIADKVYGYESGKASQEFEPRPDVGQSSYALVQRARQEARTGNWLGRLSEVPAREPRAVVRPIAAGEKVVAEIRSELYRFLRAQYGDALAVEMEGRGFLVAIHANQGVDALVIRGISDLIQDKVLADASGSQEMASWHASAFAFEVLAQFAPMARQHPDRQPRAVGEEIVWTVPYPRNPGFTGRESSLEAIRAHFLGASGLAPLALFGLGGVGKTQLAVEYAYRHTYVEPHYTHVLWVRADEPAVLASSFAGLAKELGLPEQAEPEHARKVQAVQHWLMRNDGWLLVFDNAEKPEVPRPYLPPVLRGHVLMTSRNAVWRPVATPLSVDVLARPESVALLRKGIGHADEESASELADALGDLPLALLQAAAYIEETGLPLADYLVLLAQRQHEVLARPQAPDGYPHTVTATWELSFERLQAQSPEGAALLKLCAFLDSSSIPLELLVLGAEALPEPLARAASDELLLNEAIGALRRYSLVQLHERTLLFHRLVQGVMRERLDEEERALWAGAALRLVQGFFFFDRHDLRTWSRCALLLPHTLEAMMQAYKAGASWELLPILFWHIGNYWSEQAEYVSAREFLESGLEILQGLPQALPSIEASLRQSLGHVALEVGELSAAEDHLIRARQLVEALPQDMEQQAAVAFTLGDLALLCVKRGRREEALAHARRALEIGEASLETDSPPFGVLLSRMGLVLWSQEENEQALTYVKRALAIAEARFDSPNPGIAQGLNNLAKVMETSGRHEEVRALYERSLEMTEAIYGSHHPGVAIVLINLGDVHWRSGNREKARDCYERALVIEEAFRGSNSAALVPLLNRLAKVIHAQGDFQTVRAHMERLVTVLEASHPEPSVVTSALTDVAILFARMRDYSQATLHLERVLAIDEKLHGASHQEVVKDLLNLAPILLLQGEAERSRDLLRRALSIYDTQGPLLPYEFFITLHWVGRIHYSRRDWAAARFYLERALQLREHVTVDVEKSIQLLAMLGSTLRHIGEHAAAITYLEQALAFPAEQLDAELLQVIQTELAAARSALESP